MTSSRRKRLASSIASSIAIVLASPLARAEGAVATVAAESARQLGTVPSGVLVVASPVVSDVPLSSAHPDELAVRVANLVAGRLGGAARAHTQAAPLSVARAVASKSPGLVYVSLEIVRGELRATVDLYPAMSNAWDRLRAPLPPPRAHVFARSPVDAEVRAFLPPILLEQAQIHKATHDQGDVLAVACGEPEPGAGLEIALVTRTRVTVGNVQHARFVTRRSASWADLAPRAPVSLREPLGGAAFANGELHVGTSDRGGVALDASLEPLSRLHGIPMTSGTSDASERGACLDVDASLSSFTGAPRACATGAALDAARFASDVPTFDTAGASDVVGSDGKMHSAYVVREPSGKLHVRVGNDARVIEGGGAAVALGDLDLDGVTEVVTSSSAFDDAITIYTADGASEPRLRRKIPAPGGVRALATCPPEAKGVPALVAVVGSEIWLVR